MSEARRALRLARCAALNAAVGEGRGARFARRAAGLRDPGFADMAMVPDWLMLPAAGQERIARLAGLIQYRSAIDRELSGPRLAMLADAVGEDVFDAACSTDVSCRPAYDGEVPRPEALIADGWVRLRAGLPMVFAGVHAGACGDADARALTDAAMQIEQAMSSSEATP